MAYRTNHYIRFLGSAIKTEETVNVRLKWGIIVPAADPDNMYIEDSRNVIFIG